MFTPDHLRKPLTDAMQEALECFQTLGLLVLWDELNPQAAWFRGLEPLLGNARGGWWSEILEGGGENRYQMADGTITYGSRPIVRWVVWLDNLDSEGANNFGVYFDARRENSEWVFANLDEASSHNPPFIEETILQSRGWTRVSQSWKPPEPLDLDSWMPELSSPKPT